MRHSEATRVQCKLYEKDQYIFFKISDNGIGIKEEKGNKKNKTFGLLGMKERISMLNGEFEVTSEKGKGTEISIKVPLTIERITNANNNSR
jgi:two-component system sensor histidine kinase DegS